MHHPCTKFYVTYYKARMGFWQWGMRVSPLGRAPLWFHRDSFETIQHHTERLQTVVTVKRHVEEIASPVSSFRPKWRNLFRSHWNGLCVSIRKRETCHPNLRKRWFNRRIRFHIHFHAMLHHNLPYIAQNPLCGFCVASRRHHSSFLILLASTTPKRPPCGGRFLTSSYR